MLLTIGIEPDLKLAERLTFIQEDLGKIITARHAKVRWTQPEWLYFPIKHLGFLDDSDIPEVCRAIEIAIKNRQPFTISTEGIEAAPSPQCPRIISVSLKQGLTEVNELCDALEDALNMSYIRGRFSTSKPNIMLGRVSTPTDRIDLSDCIAAIGDLNFGLSTISEVILYGAELLYSGPEYSVVSRH
ncbi:MAG: hypothetical protein II767_04265, partial [Proteobacteria bacterium]|nr:hypothetical protein [Pseudomonadota bacterium]